MQPRDRVILALDVSRIDDALNLVKELSPYVGVFKVGLELLTSVGAPRIVQEIHARNGKIFLDGKFHDIPNTVEMASKSAADLGVAFFDLHASCGKEAIERAAKVKGKSQLLAVTVLTSFSEEEARTIYGDSIENKVKQFASRAIAAGADGVVCSPKELSLLSGVEWENKWKVVPGVRSHWAATQDQKRVMSPSEAIKAGATHLVIGRPICQPPSSIGSPVKAAQQILEEIGEVS